LPLNQFKVISYYQLQNFAKLYELKKLHVSIYKSRTDKKKKYAKPVLVKLK